MKTCDLLMASSVEPRELAWVSLLLGFVPAYLRASGVRVRPKRDAERVHLLAASKTASNKVDSPAVSLRYHGFLSYSHAADGRLAPALQSALQRFARPWYRVRALLLFRDRTGLSVSPSLWPSIRDALDRSDHFILLASTQAAESRWVRQELDHWLDHREHAFDHLFIVLTEGELIWSEKNARFDPVATTALPPRLLDAVHREPHWIDLRWARDRDNLSLSYPEFQDAVATIAATLHGVSKEEISSEESRQHRRTVASAWSAAVLLLALLITANVFAWWATTQRDLATNRLSTALQKEGDDREQDNPLESILFEVEALDVDRTLRDRPHAGLRARALLNRYAEPIRLLTHDTLGAGAWLSADTTRLLTTGRDLSARVWETETGRAVTPPAPHDKPILDADLSSDGGVFATATNDTVRTWNGRDGALLGEHLFGREGLGERHDLEFFGEGRFVLSRSPARTRVFAADGCRLLHEAPRQTGLLLAAFADSEALRVTELWGSEEYAQTFVTWSAVDGSDVTRVRCSHPLASSQQGGRWLLVTEGNGDLNVFDLRTGERTAQTHVSQASEADARWATREGVVLAQDGQDGPLLMWDTRKSDQPVRFSRPAAALTWGSVESMDVDPTGRHFAAVFHKDVLLWSPSEPATPPRNVPIEGFYPRHFQFDSSGRRLLVVSSGREAIVVDAEQARPATRWISFPLEQLVRWSFSPDGNRIFLHGARRLEDFEPTVGTSVGIWTTDDADPARHSMTFDGAVHRVAVSDDDRTLAVAWSASGDLAWSDRWGLVDLSVGDVLLEAPIEREMVGVNDLRFHERSGLVLVDRIDGVVPVDPDRGKARLPRLVEDHWPGPETWSSEYARIVSTSSFGGGLLVAHSNTRTKTHTVHSWDPVGEADQTFEAEFPRSVDRVAAHTPSQSIVIWDHGGTARIYRERGEATRVLDLDTQRIDDGPFKIESAIFSHGGDFLVMTCRLIGEGGATRETEYPYRTVTWSTGDGRLVLGPLEHVTNVRRATFLGQEDRLALVEHDPVTEESTLRIWSQRATAWVAEPPVPLGPHVETVDVSGDGRLLLTVGDRETFFFGEDRNTLRIIDLDTGALVCQAYVAVPDRATPRFCLEDRCFFASPYVRAGAGYCAALIQVDTGRVVVRTPRRDGKIRRAVLSSSGRTMVALHEKGRVEILRLPHGRESVDRMKLRAQRLSGARINELNQPAPLGEPRIRELFDR